jgi:hypothetical protein
MEQGEQGELKRVAIALAVALAVLALPQQLGITRWYFLHQDWPGAAALLVAFVAALWLRPRWAWFQGVPTTPLVLGIAAALVLLLWWGTYAVMHDYPLTRDEHMVVFDAATFAAGRLAEPLPPQWSGYALALVPAFLMDTPGQALLVSAYGPVNAMMRAGFGLLGQPQLLGPLLAGVGLIALHRVSRRLFADCPGAQWVTLGGYLLSAQILANAMTPYAMTAHLAFNLVWLALFMRDKWWSHGLAIIVGVLAIGLHQVLFHPLFAGPFTLWLLAQRRWRLFGCYALAYCAALVPWTNWAHLVAASAGLAAPSGTTAGTGGFIAQQVIPLLLERDPQTFSLLLHNTLRATVWNAAFVLPFMVMAFPAVRRGEGLARPLLGGVVLTLVACTILLPYQGHGWGYRYLHGLLGNAIFLSGFGYREWAKADRPRANGAAAVLALATLPIMAWLLVSAERFAAPYARLTALIEAQPSEFAVVDTELPSPAIDQVRNRADLTNRPLTFSSKDLSAAQLHQLCARGTIMLITRREFRAARFHPEMIELDSPSFDRRLSVIRGRGCLVPARI